MKREVTGLDPHSGQRPDLQIVFPGRMLLSDVSVSTSLTAARVALTSFSANDFQTRKKKKYAAVASRLGAELLNLCVDACGGMASEATRLVRVIGEEGERWSAGTWSAVSIQRQLLSAIAVAVQRGNALTVLSGFTRTTRAGVMRGVREDAAIRERGASEDGGDSSGVEVLPVDE